MKTCLITGGCGFIGRHFTKKMTDLGYSTTIVDNMMSKSALLPDDWPKHLKCEYSFLNTDVLDYLKNTSNTFDIIIHASAIVGGRETIENDPLLISYNITIDNELFRWIEKNPVKQLVYFSSSAVYPISLQTHENHRKLKLEDIDVFNDHISIPDLTYYYSVSSSKITYTNTLLGDSSILSTFTGPLFSDINLTQLIGNFTANETIYNINKDLDIYQRSGWFFSYLTNGNLCRFLTQDVTKNNEGVYITTPGIYKSQIASGTGDYLNKNGISEIIYDNDSLIRKVNVYFN
jgi:hypothetical protein